MLCCAVLHDIHIHVCVYARPDSGTDADAGRRRRRSRRRRRRTAREGEGREGKRRQGKGKRGHVMHPCDTISLSTVCHCIGFALRFGHLQFTICSLQSAPCSLLLALRCLLFDLVRCCTWYCTYGNNTAPHVPDLLGYRAGSLSLTHTYTHTH